MSLEKLAEIRKLKGLSFKEVGESAGITKEYYWMIENGQRGLSYPLAVKIAAVFEMKPDDIFLQSELTKSELNDE
ncbi:helix-turn-helix domain-containing protein [Carnobacterium pleistocenium]|uniref:helix-turn-helix domain-containing protein n=1 Tax=Carnobacterium pleistocenium TaxID=181073 RepID=UPI000550813B|nr:helix-turn-helix transcriptional regulator [Carnobacterium pleistocenium]